MRRDLVKAVNENNVLVTTLIDFYALPVNFPKFDESKEIKDKDQRLTFLENAIVEDIQGQEYLPYLLSYIQLHEFEAFTFTDVRGFKNIFSPKEADFIKLEQIINSYKNPEDINEDKETAPSKRLMKLIPSYNKVTDGNNIIRSNGIDRLVEKCPRFRTWLETIIETIDQ